MVEIFRGKIIDVSKRSVIVEVTGSWDKIEAFERMVRPVRPDRDGPHRRDRDLARARRNLTAGVRAPVSFITCMALTVGQLTPGAARGRRRALLQRAERAVKRARKSGAAGAARVHDARRRRRRPQRRRVRLARRRRGLVLLRAAGPRRLRARRAGHRHAADARPARTRFKQVAAAWRELDAPAPSPTRRTGRPAPASSRVGGFAFAPDGGHAPHWAGFSAADLVVPEVALARRGDDVRLTLAAFAAPDDVPEELAARLAARAAGAAPRPAAAARPRARRALPRSTPSPRPSTTRPPSPRAVERIRAGAFEKIVLAREVTVHAPTPHDAAAVFGVLRAGFDSCYVFCAGRGDAAFVAASPELLIRRDGAPRPDRRAGRLHPPLRRPRRRRPPRRAAPALRQGPRGAGDRRPPDRPRAAPARRLGRRPRRADADQGREHPAPRHPDPRPARPPAERDRARRRCCTRRPPWAASRTRPPRR